MPVDYSKYPKDWKAIALAIKEAANWRCQKCDRPCRRFGQKPEEFIHSLRLLPGSDALVTEFQSKPRRFVLTVAHYPDPDPINVSPDNLHAWCSVCHLRIDASMHAKNAASTRARRNKERLVQTGQLELDFLG